MRFWTRLHKSRNYSTLIFDTGALLWQSSIFSCIPTSIDLISEAELRRDRRPCVSTLRTFSIMTLSVPATIPGNCFKLKSSVFNCLFVSSDLLAIMSTFSAIRRFCSSTELRDIRSGMLLVFFEETYRANPQPCNQCSKFPIFFHHAYHIDEFQRTSYYVFLASTDPQAISIYGIWNCSWTGALLSIENKSFVYTQDMNWWQVFLFSDISKYRIRPVRLSMMLFVHRSVSVRQYYSAARQFLHLEFRTPSYIQRTRNLDLVSLLLLVFFLCFSRHFKQNVCMHGSIFGSTIMLKTHGTLRYIVDLFQQQIWCRHFEELSWNKKLQS